MGRAGYGCRRRRGSGFELANSTLKSGKKPGRAGFFLTSALVLLDVAEQLLEAYALFGSCSAFHSRFFFRSRLGVAAVLKPTAVGDLVFRPERALSSRDQQALSSGTMSTPMQPRPDNNGFSRQAMPKPSQFRQLHTKSTALVVSGCQQILLFNGCRVTQWPGRHPRRWHNFGCTDFTGSAVSA